MSETHEMARANDSMGAGGHGQETDASLIPCEWLDCLRRIKFRLGEICLGSVSLPSLTLNTHFMRLAGGPPEPVLPFEQFPGKTKVAVANSYPVQERLPRFSLLTRAIRYVPLQYEHYYIDMTGTFSDYLEKFSSKSRSTLRKKIRKFAEFSGGEIRLLAFRPDDMKEFHRLAFGVSEKTYQARLLDNGLPEIGQFCRELANCSDARAYVLLHADKPIAYIFCPVQDGNLLYQFVGYDPDYQEWSPGTVLQYLALESLFAEGRFRTFDFTEGEGSHKEFFANRSILCADIYYFRRDPMNFLIVGFHAGLQGISRGSTRLLDRLGLKVRLKKLIRSKAGKG